ncbi:MAG TPA: hypothetical protein VGT08_21690 [Terracidiphilus sp.]|nr:hypothetical protein [Terracidiphilus sp.]
MTESNQSEPNDLDDSSAAAPLDLVDAVGNVESESGNIEESVVSPSLTLPEPPEYFLRLKSHCDQQGLASTIDLSEPFPNVAIELKNGKLSRTVYVGNEPEALALLELPIGELVFLGGYVAICSYSGRWIEAAVRAHGFGPTTRPALRTVFGNIGSKDEGPAEIEVTGPSGMTIRLVERGQILPLLDYGSRIYLRVEGIGITEHDKALNLLDDLSNALFMQIDFRFNLPLTISRETSIPRRPVRPRGQLDEDNQLSFPRHSYDRSPSSLYWYARSASSMPLLQFLAFYQCIEFFFPQYSRQETIARLKNVLKDPAFDIHRDPCMNLLLNAAVEGRRGLPEERKQLGATLKLCIDPIALRDFLNETDDRKKFYGSEYKKISDKRILIAEDQNVVEQTAERVYDIRCKVVHTKNFEGSDRDEMILPFSSEAELLADDVELIKFLARKVMVASSVPLGL